jgi:hypothetical protein
LLLTSRSMSCVWPNLGVNLRWTFYNQAIVAASPQLPSMNALGKKTQVCNDK